jgi:NAD(P)-dependent dehydrogenase (short-subunit alcohol dehydrogenase family)
MTMLGQNAIWSATSQTEDYPFGYGDPSDVANVVVFLLSEKAKFISGQNYVIDSGGVI